jgi:predicted nucleotidyltransferase
MEVIKSTIKLGNSAGVLLPREWLGSKVKVILEPLNVNKDIIEILMQEDVLHEVLGAYLVGSYARNEQDIDSDVDVLVITNSLNRRLKSGKYELIFLSEEELERQIKENALPIIPMLIEAKPVINKKLIDSSKEHSLNLKNLKYHLETTESAMNFVSKDIVLAKKNYEKVSDASAYSLVLRLRTLYIIDCIKKNKLWSKKELIKTIKDVSGSNIAYERYIEAKRKNSKESLLKAEEAERLMLYINKKLGVIKKWLREKKTEETAGRIVATGRNS